MSTAMDLSPLKLETSSVHSTSRRTPIRPSTTGSPSDNNMDVKQTYSAISFGVFSGSRTRSSYRSFRVGLDDLEFGSTKLSTTAKFSALSNERPKSTSPAVANILSNDGKNNSQDSIYLNQRTISSPVGFTEKIINHQEQDSHQQHDSDDDSAMVSNSITLDSRSFSKSEKQLSKPSKQQLSQMPMRDQDCTQNGISLDSLLPKETNLSGIYSRVTGDPINLAIDSKISDTDEEVLNDNKEQTKCTDCSKTYSNTVSFINHNCCSSPEKLQPKRSEVNLQHSPLHYNRWNERCICEAIHFPGTVIFNRNGSVFVVEDTSIDRVLNDTFNLQSDTITLNKDQSKDTSLPQVTSITFFPKRNLSLLTCLSTSSLKFCKSSPAFVSYLVLDIKTCEARDFLNLVSSSEIYDQLQKPILMCFRCKLIFLKRKSLLSHSVCCHGMILSEGDKLLFLEHNTSAITLISGDNSLAKLLILFPVNNIYSTSLGNSKLAVPLKRKLADYVANNACLYSDEISSFCDYDDNTITSQDMTVKRSHDDSAIEDFNSSLKLEEDANSTELSSESPPPPHKQLRKEETLSSTSITSSPGLSTEETSTKKNFKSTPSVFLGESPSLRLRMPSSSSTSSTFITSPPLSSAQSLLKSTSTTSSSSVLPMPPLVMSSINSFTINSQTNPSPGISLNSIQMSNFQYPCDIHSQGKPQGMECSQCDTVLNPSLPSGGHIAMSHSRNSCKTLKCPKCNWHYKYHETLEIHMKEKHPDNEAQCVYCISSQIHPRLARGESYSCGYKPYRCEVCNYSTTTKGNLSIHMQSDKHINNIQDLATGNSEPKHQIQQPPSSLSLPVTNTTFSQNISSFSQDDQFQQDDLQFLREKQKQSFRCGICSYETSVARNLRIHMTSEKHTQKVLVMTQSMSRLHQDMAFHQANHVNQLLAINDSDQTARFAKISRHVPNSLFFNEDHSTTPVSVNFHQILFDDTATLAKENLPDECDHCASNQDASKMFQCCICCKYSSDSVENVLNHIQYDRTKSSTGECHISFNSGTYFCNLCSYKTHLKANFHLHCKTDKHLQKLQIVNHVREGGPENEWRRLKSTSSVQICCNACSFHANSTQKIKFHLTSSQHVTCTKLFRHLQLLDHSAPSLDQSYIRCYHCSICNVNVLTKQKLIIHSRTTHHLHKENSLHQRNALIFDVYQLKETLAGERITSEDADAENGTAHTENSETESSLASSKKPASISNHLKIAVSSSSSSSSSAYHGSITAAVTSSSSSSCCVVSSNAATSTDVLRPDLDDEDFHEYGNITDSPETDGHLRTLTVASKISGSSSSTQISTSVSSIREDLKCARSGNEDRRNTCRRGIEGLVNPHSTPTQVESLPGAGPKHSESILCPLCRYECVQERLLAEHLVKEHNVVQEGIEKILSMVEMPFSNSSSVSSPGGSSASSRSSSSCNSSSSNNREKVPPLPSTLSSTCTAVVEALHEKQEAVLYSTDSSESKMVSNVPDNHMHRTVPDGNSSNMDTNIAYPHTLSASSSSETSSSISSIVSPALVVTHNHAQSSSLSNHGFIPDNRVNVTVSLKNKKTEINLERLETENANLLITEAIDLTLQEQLDKEVEDMLRCQTCGKSFTDIDRLFDHQNELGHMELKQTPRGAGYLCWKKGCNQYFKTASTLQIHFREIHAKALSAGVLTPEELDLYKLKCKQCSYSFKSIAAMQKHNLIHLIYSVSQCRICYKRFNSVRKMERHFETDHASLGSSDLNVHIERIQTNASLLFDTPGSEQFLSSILLINGNSKSKNGISNIEETIPEGKTLTNGEDIQENKEQFVDSFYKNENALENCKDKKFLEEYLNSPSVAEDYYKSTERRFKCHTCKMGFTSQRYLFVHNKTSFHRGNEQVELFDSQPTPFRCDLCKESFPLRSILQVHCNSASHLHKLKQQTQVSDDSRILIQTSPHLIPHTMSPYSLGNITSTTAYTIDKDIISDVSNGNSANMKPYRCNICKVSYNNLPSFEIHVRSVGHKTKSSKLGELIQSGQVDFTQALIEHPDPRTAGKQQAQLIADMIHQQASAQAASTAAFFNLHSLQSINAMPHEMAQAQIDAYYSSINPQFNETRKVDTFKLTSSREYLKEKHSQASSTLGSPDVTAQTILNEDDKTEPDSNSNSIMTVSETKCQGEGRGMKKDDEFPPHFHAPVIARPRGFMGRFKPQLYKSLLENFGFECVMLYNEENTRRRKDVDVKEDDDLEDSYENVLASNEELDAKERVEDEDEIKNCTEKDEDSKDIVKVDEDSKEIVKKYETNCSIDLTEVSKRQCKTCHKDFSNVWVLKNHEEDAHDFSISPEVIEKFGQTFKKEWIKNLPRSQEQEPLSNPQIFPNVPTPTATTAAENIQTKDMPPPNPTLVPQLQPHFELSQLFPFMGMNLLPMHLSLNLVNLGLQNSLMPSLMMPGMDLSQGFLHMPPPSCAESPTSLSAQQQFLAATSAANAHNQKRVRTRITDDQLKVLRQYFDINNSPSEEQVNKMANQTGLAQKVIKHWFRNTLFKERQRNKDSPYNFNNPPSTSIDLDEYDRTGKIPEIKLEPDDEYDGTSTPVLDVKKEHPPAAEDSPEVRPELERESFESNSLKIDFTPSTETNDEGRKDLDSYSNSSSPFMSSIPSTPTTSAPPTPIPVITANPNNSINSNPINTNNTLAFSLDNFAASISRIEAAAFHNLGKRANRTRFTDYQIKTLQDYFERNAYPKDDELEHLSKNLRLSARVIVVWFQNARQKARKTFENHPPNESIKESPGPFQRTPGMNYQCKKCTSVYQRYYELIKHQKHCCVGESNNNRTLISMTEDDSNFSYSNDDSSFSDRQSTPAPVYKEKDFYPRQQVHEPQCVPITSTSKIPLASSTPLVTSPQSSTPSPLLALKCDKCPTTFSRFDTRQEHVRTHNSTPSVFVPFSSSSAFESLQDSCSHEDNKTTITTMATHSPLLSSLMPTPISACDLPFASRTTPTSSLSLSPSSKRKTDSEDDSGEQPKDKRLRTTILPEQLDYLYQQYQIDCNPSRKQLEHIAATVNLKKRVVQVWFQNTRARERKGHYRTHQQLINKRCPFCRALFRAKSALESHLATKHPEEMAKGDINIDLIPDALPEPPNSHSHTPMPGFSGHDMPHISSSNQIMDINKFMPQQTAIPNYMTLMSTPSGFNLPFHGSTPEMLSHAPFEDNFFKKYLNDMVNNMAMRQEHPLQQSNIHTSLPASASGHSTPKPPTHQSPSLSQQSRPLDAHRMRTTPQPVAHPSNDDSPLDLSKPVKITETVHNDTPSRANYSSYLDCNEQQKETNYMKRMSSMDESFSETQSEMLDHEYTNDLGTSPPSPSYNINSLNHATSSTPCSIGKRYRTQMSAAQVKVMKNLFQDYKTPTMAECELLAHEIGLAKRVVQVWFQNARAKEKKARLNSGNPFNPETDFPKTPEECKLCSYKYTHKVTVQDHIFTKTHIDRVKAFLSSQGFQENDLCSPGFQGLSHSQTDAEQSHKMWDNSSRHLAQIKAIELNSAVMGYPISQDERSLKSLEKEPHRKENKMDGLPSKDEKKHNQATLEMAMNVQMLSALGGYMPGLEPAYLPYMYNGLPGYFPGMGLPMMQPGLIPEHMLTYDTLAYGTPLALLQIPTAAIKSISEKVTESGAVLARYTQDCQALADLHNIVEAADLTVAAEATLDVGYICKKCHMVYPARDSCVAHQNSVCMANKPPLPKEFEPIMKLEQAQYECRACRERFSTILEFKSHCQQELHKHKLMKFKAREAARHEATGSPSSSAPYASSSSSAPYASSSSSASFASPSSKIISSSVHLSKPFTTSPSNNNNNNNNNNRIHNNNQVTIPDVDHNWKPSLVKSASPLCSKSSPAATSLYSDKHLLLPSQNYLT